MDILTIMQAVLRRWYVALPVLLVSLGIAFLVNSTIPPAYEAEGQILLASPDLDPAGLPRSVAGLGDLGRQLMTDDVQAPLTVGSSAVDVGAASNLLALEVSSGSAADAQATIDRIVTWLSDRVEERQVAANIDPTERVRVQALNAEGVEAPPSPAGTINSAGDEELSLSTTIRLDDPAAETVNPFGASIATARILTVALESDDGRRSVAERAGPGVSFTLSQDVRDAAPIITVTTTGADPEAVQEGFGHVAAAASASLAEREARAEVPESRRTRVEQLAVPQRVTDISPPLDRSVAAILGLGGMTALLVALFADSFIERRRMEAARVEGDPRWTTDRVPASQDLQPDGESRP